MLDAATASLKGVPFRPQAWMAGAGTGLAQDLDWSLLLTCVRHHRLDLLMTSLLDPEADIPEHVRAALKQGERAATAVALQRAGELARVARCFSDAGIDMLALKGPVLSAQIHGHPFRRVCSDLDLLVRPDDEGPARRLLLGLGYGGTDADVLVCQNAVTLRHGRTGALIDLHTRMGEDERLAPTRAFRPFETAVEVQLAGVRVRTPALPASMAYAAYHGAHHRWFRLQWLADIAAVTRRTDLDWAEVAEIARLAGTERHLALSLRLCRSLFGCEPAGIPPMFPRLPARARAGVLQAESVVPMALALPPLSEYDMVRRVGRFRILRAELALTQRRSAWLARLRLRLQPTVTDRNFLRLPPALGFLYYAVRFIRVLWETGRAGLPHRPLQHPDRRPGAHRGP
ncbi:nucleotidyltransferase family protein [Azospirillum sp. B506]|uniref:nucleotidyltransferase domain-containing protein n=1 Tax=Azospirillum sp. B506 TaxID=137721 RepID=UPI00131F0C92|nr:nucleotidyltransferase family protein [Azospirillum sp. B506]